MSELIDFYKKEKKLGKSNLSYSPENDMKYKFACTLQIKTLQLRSFQFAWPLLTSRTWKLLPSWHHTCSMTPSSRNTYCTVRQPPHTVILPNWTFKKWGLSLILPSSITRNLSAPNAKIIFEILWGILEGGTIRARPSRPFLKNLFMEFEFYFGPNDFIWSAM